MTNDAWLLRQPRFGLLPAFLCASMLGLAGKTPSRATAAGDVHTLHNEFIQATFVNQGLAALRDLDTGAEIRFAQEQWTLEVDDQSFRSSDLRVETVRREAAALTFRYPLPQGRVEVVYELKPGWRFVSKQVRLDRPGEYRVKRAEVLAARLDPPPADLHRLRGGSYGAFLRFLANPAATNEPPAYGLFAVLQNPYQQFELQEGRLALRYQPEMDWSDRFGPFETDRACLGLHRLSGTRYPAQMVPEWAYLPDPHEHGRTGPWVDLEEVLALTDCVRAFTLYQPKKSIRFHVDWCENAYQIDVAKPEGWAEYQRIIQRAAEVGCDHVLFTPDDSILASLRENRDAWGWESLLWLNLGQKIRKGEWVPGRDPLPDAVQRRLDFARLHGVRLAAYVYPTLPFLQDPAWTAWVKALPGSPNPGGYRGADTGLRSFQDWLVQQLVAFQRQTGLGGYSFDHWWIAYKESSTSQYAQWHGCRRILSELRRQCPDLVLDGRQQYHQFGPWTWVGGSYPHPLASDEQPQSFRSFPDLHWSRGSADRQRYMGWWFRMQNFCPPELMPGYMTHQTMRNDADKKMRRDRFRTRDWDYLGWKYSVLSSIATAPIHHVVNYLPARDEAEFRAFSEADKQWLRDWLDWTDRHFELLRRVRPILGQPMVGRTDGTAAVDGERGFVFLFNPNYRPLEARFRLDQSIGLTRGQGFVLRQLYPDLGKGRLLGHPQKGLWSRGEEVVLAMDGAQAMVLELVPVHEPPAAPLLLNVPGRVRLAGDTLELTGLAGEIGRDQTVVVLLPRAGAGLKVAMVNGRKTPFRQEGNRVTMPIRFAGEPFAHCQPIGVYDPAFAGRTVARSFRVPKRIFEQLEARRRAWPIPYTEDDLLATWNGPHRLLLFINIAEPKDSMEVSLKLDGRSLEVRKAYSSVYAQAVDRTFLGFYVDLTSPAVGLEPDTAARLELGLPEGLKPGQFQGLFFDNVETEFTDQIATGVTGD